MSRFFRRFVLVIAVVIFAGVFVSYFLGELGYIGVRADDEQGAAYKQMRVYAEVLRKIQNYYVTTPNIPAVTTGALHGLLDSLDPDSSYLTPAEYKIYKDRPATDNAQVGLTISKRFGYATVVNVLPGSPADQEHMRDGDVIDLIDGQSTHDLPLAIMRFMLSGKPGTTVTLSIVRPFKPDPDTVKLTRAALNVPPLGEQFYENASILYLKPGVLSAGRLDDIAARIKAAKGKKILLDLRDTTGDDPKQGVRLANFFIKQGTLASLVGQTFPLQTFNADPSLFLTDAPVAVLVNRGTYGAPEIAAAAIEDLKRGDVVGEHTFGEGTVQKTIDLPDGAGLMLTVAKYEDPDGKKIQDEAVTPNVVVASPEDDGEPMPASNGDAPLNQALSLLKAKNG
ncbi:MAG TPA: S41 family peptidase [Terracidiphilus sp.]|nr:S41 family peptidase [Terracidiphilus sp.]